MYAAHLNHGWRSNAHEDQAFCITLCQQFNIPLFTANAQDFKEVKANGSLEEYGRKLRRTFFDQILHQKSIDYITLAHHTDDQEETFFIRLLRGASLTGLCSIQALTGNYIHPLLNISKKQIIEYLTTHKLAYCIDQTNNESFSLRNKIRHQLLPLIKNIDPRFSTTFAHTIQRLQEEESFLTTITNATYSAIFKNETTFIKGTLSYFHNLNSEPTIQKRILLKWLIENKVSFTPSNGLLEELLRFLKTLQGGTHHLGNGWSCIKKSKFFWILKK